MKHVNKIQDELTRFLGNGEARQFALLFSAYLFIYFSTVGVEYYQPFSFLLLISFLIIILAYRSAIYTRGFWIITTLLLVLKVAECWHNAANHTILLIFLGLLMVAAYSLPEQERNKYVKKQARLIFAMVMFMAGIQKLLSPDYINGSVLEFMFLTGDIVPSLIRNDFFAFSQPIKNNLDFFYSFSSYFSESANVRFPWQSPFFHTIAKPFAWFTILAEILLGILALKFFDNRIYQTCVLLFVAGVFIVTPEGGFLSLLLILAWNQLPQKQNLMHMLYATALLLIAGFVIARVSFP